MDFKNSIELGLVILLAFGCSPSGDTANPNSNPPDPNPSIVTYEGTVKAIITNNCTSCHKNPAINGASVPLTTYAGAKGAVDNNSLLVRINNVSSPMPPSGLMSQANRDLIQQWKDDGFIEQ